MKLYAKISYQLKALNRYPFTVKVVAKSPIFDVWQGSEYTSLQAVISAKRNRFYTADTVSNLKVYLKWCYNLQKVIWTYRVLSFFCEHLPGGIHSVSHVRVWNYLVHLKIEVLWNLPIFNGETFA